MGIKEKLESPFKKKYEGFKSERTHKKFVADIQSYSKREAESESAERIGKAEAQEKERRTMYEVRHPKPKLYQKLGAKAGEFVKQEMVKSRGVPARAVKKGRALSQQKVFSPITQAPSQRGFITAGDQSIQRQGGLSPMLEGAFFGGTQSSGGFSAMQRAFSNQPARQPTARRSRKKKMLGRKPKYLSGYNLY
jgi:hypothetical protein